MGFRQMFFTPRRLPQRIRSRVAAALARSDSDDPRARSCEFPGHALQLALRQ